MQPILITSGLSKSYLTGINGHLDILKGVDLVVQRGEMLAIVGPSGVGKSTLLHILGALDRPTRGNVEVDGIPIFDYSDKQLASFRNREIGFVFQFHHLLEEFNALENVLMPALISGYKISKIRQRGMAILSRVGLADRWSHRPGELSGGEQQRVAVGRALMNEPKLILADEPSGNLDTASAADLHNLLWQLTRKEGRTIIVVTHNLQLAGLADRIIRIEDGRAIEERKNGRN